MTSAVPHADRRELFGWQMYDWAVSAYTTTVTTALLGPYLLDLAEKTDGVRLGGLRIAPASFYPFAVAAAAIIEVVLLPMLGAVADHTPHKKRLMMSLAYLGSAMLAGLFAVTTSTVVLGGALFVVASVALGASTVIYNSYLPEIAPPEARDRLSATGYAWGYLGGGLWLACNFALIAVMSDTALAVRISLGGTGLWCAFFFWLYPGRRLQRRPPARSKPAGTGWVSFSLRSVWRVLVEMRRDHPQTFRYLIAYLLFTDGLLTVIAVATSFAADELDASKETLLALVLMIQIVAIGGAVAVGRLAEVFGAKRCLMAMLGVWVVLVVYAFAFLRTITQLWVLGVLLALVLGGTGSLSRSLYAQLIPRSREAEYFGFYEITATGTSWLGPALFGLANQVLGSQRDAILSLVILFVAGLAVLVPVQVARGMRDAGQDPTLVRL